MKINTILSNQIKKYRPNLPTLMQLCERNYSLMMQLLLRKVALTNSENLTADKSLENVDSVGKQLKFFISSQLDYSLEIKEVTRYTTVVHIAQNNHHMTNNLHQAFEQVLSPSMVVRLYHDARVAEVNSSQNIRWIKPRYDYPNKKMHQPDEKQQSYQFLKDWLLLCLENGQLDISLSTQA